MCLCSCRCNYLLSGMACYHVLILLSYCHASNNSTYNTYLTQDSHHSPAYLK